MPSYCKREGVDTVRFFLNIRMELPARSGLRRSGRSSAAEKQKWRSCTERSSGAYSGLSVSRPTSASGGGQSRGTSCGAPVPAHVSVHDDHRNSDHQTSHRGGI